MANISSINLPDGSSYNFKDSVSGYISNTGVYGIYYGACSTAAGTAAKVATLNNADGFSLTKGITVAIKFSNSNTIANPTLNVNSSGAKSIKRYSTTAPSTSAGSSWNAGSVLILVYDGSYWQIVNWLNTTYSEMSTTEISAGTSTTARLISPANLKTAIQTWSAGEANVQSDWEQTDDTADDFIKNKPTPLIGSSSNITPSQVMTAIDEGRDIVVYHTGDIEGVDTNFTFTSWNRATDVDFGGAVLDVVVSDTIAALNSQFYLYELVGGTFQGEPMSWMLISTILAKKTDIPTNVSAFNNDVGYLRNESDPTVPSWAKESSKPTYTASEVGAQPTLVSGTNIKTINGDSILGSGNLVVSGGGSEPTMQTLSVTSGGTGTWYYRTWPSGWQEAWYQGSIQFTSASSSAGGWNRSTKNFALPISFADNACIQVSGSTSGRVYTQGGIKTSGTQFEAQILGGAALSASTYSGWSVYVAGYGRT